VPRTNARVALQVANHMWYLEALAEAQAERLDTLTELVDHLQRKNTSLKQARWSSAYGVFGGYDQHAGPEALRTLRLSSHRKALVLEPGATAAWKLQTGNFNQDEGSAQKDSLFDLQKDRLSLLRWPAVSSKVSKFSRVRVDGNIIRSCQRCRPPPNPF
jgi:hypothetical protein